MLTTATGPHASVLGACCLIRGVQEDRQEAAFVVGGVVGEVAFDVYDGLCEQVETVSELVELFAGHDQLVLAEAELGGASAGFVVALAAGSPAVETGASGTGGGFVCATAPAASRPGFP